VFALNNSLDWSPLPRGNLLTMIVTLNVYEVFLIALAIFLLGRNVRRDAMMLLLIEAFFLADVGFLNMEVFATDAKVGLLVNTLVLAAAVVKVALVFRAAGIPLLDGRFAFVVMQLAILFAIPGIFAIVAQPHDQKLPMLAIYGGWWLAGLLPVAYAVLVGSFDLFRQPPDGRPAGIDVIVARVLLVLPMLSLIAHLCLANWVYKVTFHPLNLAPLLIGLAVAIGRADQHVATLAWRMRMQLALPFVAIALSAIRFPHEMMFPLAGVSISPLRIALAAAAMAYLDGLWLHRHAYFAWAAGACLAMTGMGHSVASINTNSIEMAKTSASPFDKFVPKTLAQWGVASVAMAFVLLALGAMLSLMRRAPEPVIDDGEARTSD
jgi:hypothetical protein